MRLLKIADLVSLPNAAGILSARWDPAAELETWAKTVHELGLQERVEHTWNQPPTGGYFHPSALYNTCNAYHFFMLHNEKREERKGASILRILDHGTALHLLLHFYTATHARHHGYSASPEFRIKDLPEARRLRMDGHIDELVTRRFGDLETRYVVDYKSTKAASFEKLRRPMKDNLRQLHAYMKVVDAPVGVLLYINKDATTFKSFVFSFDALLWAPIEQRLLSVLAQARTGDLTAVEKRINKGCGWCPYFSICKPENQWKTTALPPRPPTSSSRRRSSSALPVKS